MSTTLYQKVVDARAHGSTLTGYDINQLVDLLTKRCKLKTMTRVRSVLTWGLGSIQAYGILDRVVYENGEWSYCAGQSYPDEIRTVREIIMGRI